jgi:hypothetical protein
MDNQVKTSRKVNATKEDDMKMMVFDVFKNIIIEQNKQLLKIIADKYDLEYDDLLQKYMTPDNYLPVITKT